MELTRQLLQYCLQAYEADSVDLGFHHYYIESDNVVVISGTNSYSDWHLFNLKPFPLMPFHRSFQSIAGELLNFYMPYTNEKTIFVGHSAGGCIAYIMAEFTGGTSVSFGSPLLVKKGHISNEVASHTMYKLKYDPVSWVNNYTANNIEIVEVPGVGHGIKRYIKCMYKNDIS